MWPSCRIVRVPAGHRVWPRLLGVRARSRFPTQPRRSALARRPARPARARSLVSPPLVSPPPVVWPRSAGRAVAMFVSLVVAVACATAPSAGDRGPSASGSTKPGTATVTTPAGPSTVVVGAPGTPITPGGSVPPTLLSPEDLRLAFAATDAAMQRRVSGAGLAGGVVLVVRGGEVVLDRSYGSVRRDTPMGVASAAKWFTAATLLTLVDDGLLSLDDPVSRWLPRFDGDKAGVTVRRLLSHTSGVRDHACIWDTSAVFAECVDRLAAIPVQFAPGSAFSYGNGPFHVAARVAEVVTGTDFPTLFAQRIATPLAMTATTWPGAGRNPSPAAGVRTTVDDYARFLEAMLDGGVSGGRRVLSDASVREIERNQVAGHDTSHDYAVGITRIPTYGLGLWRDAVDTDDVAVVVSGNGAGGFYPWIDRVHHAYGIVGVEDRRGAEVAVPASKAVVELALAATASLG